MSIAAAAQSPAPSSQYAKLGLNRLRELAQRYPSFEDFDRAIEEEATGHGLSTSES